MSFEILNTALITTALLMGLAGSPHCAVMCGAACAGVAKRCGGHRPSAALTALHAGRVLSYAVAGAVVAASASALATWGQEIRWLQPFWGMLHAAAVALGVYLLWSGQQPAWMASWGQGAQRAAAAPSALAPSGAALTRNAMARDVSRPAPVAFHRRGPVHAGVLGLAWAAWPCGLLQSALLVAALAATPTQGAAVMSAFAVGSTAGLWLVPWVWLRMQGRVGRGRASSPFLSHLSSPLSSRMAIRLAGALLAGASLWALTHGLWAGWVRAFC